MLFQVDHMQNSELLYLLASLKVKYSTPAIKKIFLKLSSYTVSDQVFISTSQQCVVPEKS